MISFPKSSQEYAVCCSIRHTNLSAPIRTAYYTLYTKPLYQCKQLSSEGQQTYIASFHHKPHVVSELVKVRDYSGWGGVTFKIQSSEGHLQQGNREWRGGGRDEGKLSWSFHWACCAPNAALDVIGSQKAVHYRGWARQQNRKGWKEKENVSFFAQCLCPGTIMGQELIKRAVDASVFLINLTSALIKFVMTAELVPVCHQTQQRGRNY